MAQQTEAPLPVYVPAAPVARQPMSKSMKALPLIVIGIALLYAGYLYLPVFQMLVGDKTTRTEGLVVLQMPGTGWQEFDSDYSSDYVENGWQFNDHKLDVEVTRGIKGVTTNDLGGELIDFRRLAYWPDSAKLTDAKWQGMQAVRVEGEYNLNTAKHFVGYAFIYDSHFYYVEASSLNNHWGSGGFSAVSTMLDNVRLVK